MAASSQKKTFLCVHCGACLKTRSGLRKHTRSHERNAPYSCCGKLFFSEDKLQMHRCNVHGEKKTKICQVCDAPFATKQTLKQHMLQVHTTDRQMHRCHVCQQEFVQKQTWSDHMDKHNGCKSHSCQQCGKTYQHLSGLTRHKKSCKV